MSKVIKPVQKRSNKLKKDTLDKMIGFFEGDKDLSENVDLYLYGEKMRTAYKKILESRDAFLKAGVSSEKVYRESKKQLEKRPLKRKKITKEFSSK